MDFQRTERPRGGGPAGGQDSIAEEPRSTPEPESLRIAIFGPHPPRPTQELTEAIFSQASRWALRGLVARRRLVRWSTPRLPLPPPARLCDDACSQFLPQGFKSPQPHNVSHGPGTLPPGVSVLPRSGAPVRSEW